MPRQSASLRTAAPARRRRLQCAPRPLGGAALPARANPAAARCAPVPPPPGGPPGVQLGAGPQAGSRGQLGTASSRRPTVLRMLLPDADRPEPVRSGASELALFLTPELGAEEREVEAAVDRILLALEEFCSLADMIRSDTSQMLEKNIPLLKAKVTEVRSIYAQVDRLEAFIKMVGHHTAFLEAHVLRAEQDHGTFPQALWRWLGSAGLPSFGNKPVAPAPQPYELPMLYRTEDYFPMDTQEAKREVP